jgi:hypothetical protein
LSGRWIPDFGLLLVFVLADEHALADRLDDLKVLAEAVLFGVGHEEEQGYRDRREKGSGVEVGCQEFRSSGVEWAMQAASAPAL